jgi:hypothetical protein
MGLDRVEGLVGVDADELLVGRQRHGGKGFQGDRLRLELWDAQDRGVVVRGIEYYAPEFGRAVVSVNLRKLYFRRISFPRGTSL